MALTIEIEKALENCLENLTAKQLKVWKLCMQEGISLGRAASLLGCSKSLVQFHLYRARKKVTEEIKQGEYNG